MKKEKIYLIGQISFQAVETYLWRERVENLLPYDKFEIFNPCKNEFNLELNKSVARLSDVYVENGIDILVPKDKSYVLNSDIAIANLNWYDEEKLVIGTLFELAWYHDHPEKTVIGICNDENQMCNHPFVKSVVTVWVKDETEACALILKYFG